MCGSGSGTVVDHGSVVGHQFRVRRRAAEDRARLPTRLDPVRQLVIQLNDVGIELTRAIVDAGLGEVSTNVATTVLTKLSVDGPTRPRDLLQPTGLTRGGLTNLLDRLESSNLIVRTYGEVPGDRRGALVTITDTGAAAIEQVAAVVARSLEQQRQGIVELSATLARATSGGTPSDTSPPNASPMHRSDIEVLERLSQVGTALDGAFAGDDPTPGRTAIVLCSAAQRGGTRPKQLIRRTQLTSGGVTQLLDRLEAAGLIRRTSGRPPDRRAVVVELTTGGVRHLASMLDELVRGLDVIKATVDDLDIRADRMATSRWVPSPVVPDRRASHRRAR